MRNFNENFEKYVTYDNIKNHKKAGLGPHYTRYFFWKTTKKGSNWPAPPPPFSAALGLKQALNLILVLKKVHRFIEFNQEPLVKTIYWYEHRAKKKVKNEFEKDFFMFMNNAAFGKTMENVRKYRDTNLVANKARRNYLVSEPKNHTFFFIKRIHHRYS